MREPKTALWTPVRGGVVGTSRLVFGKEGSIPKPKHSPCNSGQSEAICSSLLTLGKTYSSTNSDPILSACGFRGGNSLCKSWPDLRCSAVGGRGKGAAFQYEDLRLQ